MDTMLGAVFLKYSADKLEQLGGRIRDCLGRLTAGQIWQRGGDNENAIGNLVLHLCGNVRQWIGHGVAGLPDIRRRDAEFAARGGFTPAELAEALQDTLQEIVPLIRDFPPERLSEGTTVQNYSLTKMEAILHVVEHFSHHTGQVLFATKLLTGEDLGYYKHLQQPVHGEKTP